MATGDAGGSSLAVLAGLRALDADGQARQYLEHVRALVIQTDETGRIVFISSGIRRIAGYEPEELLGTREEELVHPDDAKVLEKLEHSDPVEPAAERLYRIRRKDGSWACLERAFASEVDVDGGSRHRIITARDVTELVAVEEIEHERAQREFSQRTEQARRLESLGVLAGGIAHDFSNLLTPILGEANLAIGDLPEGSPVRPRLERIARSARRAADLTKQMLAYAGADAMEIEILELSHLMDEVPQLIENLVSPEIRIEYELSTDLAPVQSNAAQLLQVAMNLVSNAAEAVGDAGGRISIRTGRMDLRDGATHNFSYGSLSTGEYVYLEVEDDGCGMDAETRARIFDPFFTTKFTGRGLGLAAVLGIVRAHGGALDLDSEVGRGTRFRVLLPVWQGERETRAPLPRGANRDRASGTVLVIDDDESVVEIISETLLRIGLEVLGTTDAAEGIELFRRHAPRVGLVLVDRAMPGISGEALIGELRRIRAEARVLLLSGYSESRIASEIGDQQLDGFLQKPFYPEGLVERVRELLNRQDSPSAQDSSNEEPAR